MAAFEIHDEDLVRLKDQVVLVTGMRSIFYQRVNEHF